MPTSADFIEGSNVSIGHLGIVAGAFDTLGIAGVVDRAIPKTRHHHLTHGDIVKAMVLNGLGFVERRLYLYPEFFSDIAVDRLLGDGVTIDHLNDDVLGRTLDAIAAYGPTELFNEIVAECLLASDYGTHCLHVDTTAFSVSGEYDADTDLPRHDHHLRPSQRRSVGPQAVRPRNGDRSAWHPALSADLLRERIR